MTYRTLENTCAVREDLYWYFAGGGNRDDEYSKLEKISCTPVGFVPQTLGDQNWLFFEAKDLLVLQDFCGGDNAFSIISTFTQEDLNHWLNGIPYPVKQSVRQQNPVENNTPKSLRSYNPKDVVLTLNGTVLYGFCLEDGVVMVSKEN